MQIPSAKYATEGAYKVCVDFLALKRHFTTKSYDYHKYNGKVALNPTTFQTRPDAFSFYKLSQHRDSHNLILANVVNTPKIWIQSLLDEPAERVYVEWKRRTDALLRHFVDDIRSLDPVLQDNFIVDRGRHPLLIERLLGQQISRETFAILTHITNVFPYWEQQGVSDVVAADAIASCKKYFPFLGIDNKKFTSALKARQE